MDDVPNQQLDREQYAHLLQQRFNGYGFDHLVQPGATLADIDTDTLTQFLETANAVRNLNESLLLPTDVVLQKLDLMTDKGLTNASLMVVQHVRTRDRVSPGAPLLKKRGGSATCCRNPPRTDKAAQDVTELPGGR